MLTCKLVLVGELGRARGNGGPIRVWYRVRPRASQGLLLETQLVNGVIQSLRPAGRREYAKNIMTWIDYEILVVFIEL